jgi:hypothetical protein
MDPTIVMARRSSWLQSVDCGSDAGGSTLRPFDASVQELHATTWTGQDRR